VFASDQEEAVAAKVRVDGIYISKAQLRDPELTAPVDQPAALASKGHLLPTEGDVGTDS
jgi:hypothetical protein